MYNDNSWRKHGIHRGMDLPPFEEVDVNHDGYVEHIHETKTHCPSPSHPTMLTVRHLSVQSTCGHTLPWDRAVLSLNAAGSESPVICMQPLVFDSDI